MWRFFRPLVRRQFDALAPVWESMRMEDSLASYEAGLDTLPAAPERGSGDRRTLCSCECRPVAVEH